MKIIINKEKVYIKDIFITNVGSHIWGMNRPDSDIDKFIGYINSTTDLLLKQYGQPRSRHITDDEGNEDMHIHEIGVIVRELLDCNINYVLGVMSPIVIKDWKYLGELRELTLANLNKKCYDSIHGLATKNYKKYVVTGRDASEKRCNMIARVLNFGIILLCEGKLEFNPVKGYKPENIPPLIELLDIAYRNSVLPEQPQAYVEMMEFLLRIRMEEFVGERTDVWKLKKLEEKEENVIKC